MKITEKTIKYFFAGIFAMILVFSFFQNAEAVIVSNTVPTNGLIGYWSMDEATGTKAYDYSGNKNTGTFNATSTWVSGAVGGAASFNGQTNYINVPYKSLFFPTTGLTVSVWVYVNTWPTTSAGIVSNSLYQAGGFMIGLTSGGCIQGGTNSATVMYPFGQVCSTPTKKWMHYVLTSDNTNQWLYINGVLSGVSSSTAPYNNGLALQISGSSQGGWASDFNGNIDEVRIYNRVISATEVTKLYNAKSTRLNASAPVKIPSQNGGLVGYWSMDGKDLSSTTAFDRSGNANNGTINSAKSGIGKIGQALSFSGSSSYLNIADNPAINFTGSFTIGFWVKPNSPLASSMGFVDKKTNDSLNGYVVYRDMTAPTKINLRLKGVSNAYGLLTSSGTLDAGVWQHWSFVYDSSASTVKIYKNGALDNTYTSIAPGDLTSTTALQFAHSQTWNGYLNGSMDDVRLYNRALSDKEISQIAGVGAVKELKYDASSTAYFATAGVTNLTGRAQVDEFIKGLKSMGIWNSISEVWLMRKNQNAPSGTSIYGLKNAYNGTVTGSTTMTTDGLVMADSNSGVNFTPNATVTFSAGGPSIMSVWNGLNNAVPSYSTMFDALTFLRSSGSQLYFTISNGVGGGTTWYEQNQNIKGSRWWWNFGTSPSMSSNHMAGWNADTMHLFRDGAVSIAGQTVTVTQTDGSYTLQTRGRLSALSARESVLLFMPPGINLSDTQMNQIYKLYRDTAGYGLALP